MAVVLHAVVTGSGELASTAGRCYSVCTKVQLDWYTTSAEGNSWASAAVRANC